MKEMKENKIIRCAGIFVLVGILSFPAFTVAPNKAMTNDIGSVEGTPDPLGEEGIPQIIDIPIGGPHNQYGHVIDGDVMYSLQDEHPTDVFEYAGCGESMSEEIDVYRIPFVHTYSNRTEPPYQFESIYMDMFVAEIREPRTLASFIAITIDFRQWNHSEWHNGPMLGGRLIWEWEHFGRDYTCTYILAICRPRGDDMTYFYRNNLWYYEEIERTPEYIRVALKHHVNATGIWFHDTYPYHDDYDGQPHSVPELPHLLRGRQGTI